MKSAIEVGSLVCNSRGGWLRFGTVTHKRVGENLWAYYKVEWHNDEPYQAAQDYSSSINPKPKRSHGLTEFRSGQIHPVSPERLEQILESYRGHEEENESLKNS